jgi:hypothetical protein
VEPGLAGAEAKTTNARNIATLTTETRRTSFTSAAESVLGGYATA